MARTKLPESFNDGLLEFGKTATQRDEHAKIIGDGFERFGELFFNYQTIRQSDFEQYGTTDLSVDLKVKTYYTPNVEKSHKVIINDSIYEITGIDPDKERIYLYWYLSKVGELDANTQLIRTY